MASVYHTLSHTENRKFTDLAPFDAVYRHRGSAKSGGIVMVKQVN